LTGAARGKIVNCHQTVVELSLQSAMTAMLVVAQISARLLACASSIILHLLDFLVADGYPMKMIKITYLR
jgi:hypothetical protein